MATSDEYATVEQVLLSAMLGQEHDMLAKMNPMIARMAKGMVPAGSEQKAAHAAAILAVDALDQYRARGVGGQAKKPGT